MNEQSNIQNYKQTITCNTLLLSVTNLYISLPNTNVLCITWIHIFHYVDMWKEMEEHLVIFHFVYHSSLKGWTIQYQTYYIRNNTTHLYCY
jgi:hypothetical protein